MSLVRLLPRLYIHELLDLHPRAEHELLGHSGGIHPCASVPCVLLRLEHSHAAWVMHVTCALKQCVLAPHRRQASHCTPRAPSARPAWRPLAR